MRLCLLTPVFLPDIGGAEIVIDALARRFQSMGHQVVVVVNAPPVVLDVPYPVHWIRKPPFAKWFPERISHDLKLAHAEHRFDLIFTNYAHPTGFAAVRTAARAGIPVVIGSQGGDVFHSSKHRNQPHVWKRTVEALKHADGLVAISPHTEALIREIVGTPRLMANIPNGVDLAEFADPGSLPRDVDDPRPFCLCLGNIGPLKGFDDAIDAFGQCGDRLDGLNLVVVGSGPMEQIIRDRARRINLDGRVRFTGHRVGKEKRWFLQNCLYGIMPSIEEGLPLVALEFMACGKPLIGTTNPSFDELSLEGRQIVRVPPRAPQVLADAMVDMHRSNREAMSDDARRRAGAFEWSNIVRRYLSFFEHVLDKRHHARSVNSD